LRRRGGRILRAVRRGAQVRGERIGKQRFQFSHALFGRGPEQRVTPEIVLRQFGPAREGDQDHYQNGPSHEAEQKSKRTGRYLAARPLRSRASTTRQPRSTPPAHQRQSAKKAISHCVSAPPGQYAECKARPNRQNVPRSTVPQSSQSSRTLRPAGRATCRATQRGDHGHHRVVETRKHLQLVRRRVIAAAAQSGLPHLHERRRCSRPVGERSGTQQCASSAVSLFPMFRYMRALPPPSNLLTQPWAAVSSSKVPIWTTKRLPAGEAGVFGFGVAAVAGAVASTGGLTACAAVAAGGGATGFASGCGAAALACACACAATGLEVCFESGFESGFEATTAALSVAAAGPSGATPAWVSADESTAPPSVASL